MASGFGERLRVSIYGESHGNGIGALIEGLPPGESVDFDRLMRFMERRQGGRSPISRSLCPVFLTAERPVSRCVSGSRIRIRAPEIIAILR